MKINLFKVILFTFLVSALCSVAAYFILVLMFNDGLYMLEDAGRFLGISFAEISGIFVFSILFMVSYFLPLYHIKKNQIIQKTAPELFRIFMPLVTLIATMFALIVLLISTPGNGIAGEGWINIYLFYILSYSGLIAFLYRIKRP